MRILAMEPFYGGSHRAFIDGWIDNSRHEFNLLTLPASKWKWRMRHAAITFAEQARDFAEEGIMPDAVLATDMLDLAAWRGLVGMPLAGLPAVVYFHENQLTYPVTEERERDYHFGFTNIVTALAAEQVWFNSDFHRSEFVDAVGVFLERMPDNRMPEGSSAIDARASVQYPGIDSPPIRSGGHTGPRHILWAARWEHDKGPEEFFEALRRLRADGHEFRMSVVGEQFETQPEVFDRAREEFSDRIVRWGHQPSRTEYWDALHEADVVVSTARHEFFGIAVVEAISAGCFPLLPDRLSYPEIVQRLDLDSNRHLYDGTVDHLTTRLAELIDQRPDLDPTDSVDRFFWQAAAQSMDDAIEELVK